MLASLLPGPTKPWRIVLRLMRHGQLSMHLTSTTIASTPPHSNSLTITQWNILVTSISKIAGPFRPLSHGSTMVRQDFSDISSMRHTPSSGLTCRHHILKRMTISSCTTHRVELPITWPQALWLSMHLPLAPGMVDLRKALRIASSGTVQYVALGYWLTTSVVLFQRPLQGTVG